MLCSSSTQLKWQPHALAQSGPYIRCMHGAFGIVNLHSPRCGAEAAATSKRIPRLSSAAVVVRPKQQHVSQLSSAANGAWTSVDTFATEYGPVSTETVPLQVTRNNFTAVLPAVKSALQDCQFFSFDCEMTGLFLQGQEDYAVDDVDDTYMKTAAAAEQFLVTQFGLTAFTWTGSCYQVRSFNFHLFPAPSDDMDLRFTCQASSLAFLASHGFDFNKMIYEGVAFLPLSWRDKQLAGSGTTRQAAAAAVPVFDDLDDDERCLLEQLQEDISAWLDSDDPSGLAMYVPAAPPQLQKLQRALLAAGIGSSAWQGSSSSSSNNSSSRGSRLDKLYIVQRNSQIGPQQFANSSSSTTSSVGFVLQRATAAEVQAAFERSQQDQEQQITAATGFSQVFELIRDSCKPAVGHNVRFDLAFAMAAFVQNPLPKSWSGFKQLVGVWFPGGVYDTKYLARCLSCSNGTTPLLPNTGLGSLFELLAGQDDLAQSQQMSSNRQNIQSSRSRLSAWLDEQTTVLENAAAWQQLPAVTHAPGCEEYAEAAEPAAAGAAAGVAHEAGFDAFMTGAVFVGLLRLFEIKSLAQRSRWHLPVAPTVPPDLSMVQQYAWRQHCGQDVQYAALQGPEPVPNRPNVVYVTGFKSGTRWLTIQQRFAVLGVDKPVISMVRSNGLFAPATGAYAIFKNAKQARKAVLEFRKSSWGKAQAMPYSDYFYSKNGQYSSSDGSSSSSSTLLTAAGSRQAPDAVQLPVAVRGGSEGATSSATSSVGSTVALQEMQKLTQQLQRKVEVLEQQQQQQQQQEDVQMAAAAAAAISWSVEETEVDLDVPEPPEAAVGGAGSTVPADSAHPALHKHQARDRDAASSSSSSSSTTAASSTSVPADSNAAVGSPPLSEQQAALVEAQRRLVSISNTAEGKRLKRPAARPQLH